MGKPCKSCGRVKRRYCVYRRGQHPSGVLTCAICCACPGPDPNEGDADDDRLTAEQRRWFGHPAPPLAVSTPQAPGGCSCTKCLTWVHFFPALHRQWLEFAREKERAQRHRRQSPWYFGAWAHEWKQFQQGCGDGK